MDINSSFFPTPLFRLPPNSFTPFHWLFYFTPPIFYSTDYTPSFTISFLLILTYSHLSILFPIFSFPLSSLLSFHFSLPIYSHSFSLSRNSSQCSAVMKKNMQYSYAVDSSVYKLSPDLLLAMPFPRALELHMYSLNLKMVKWNCITHQMGILMILEIIFVQFWVLGRLLDKIM